LLAIVGIRHPAQIATLLPLVAHAYRSTRMFVTS